MERVIIDTDPALGVPLRDVDDGLALILALREPHLNVEGITITHGNTSCKRAFLSARRTTKAVGREDVPVYAGAKTRCNNRLLRDISETDASRFITERLEAEPGEITLVTLGPLSNILTAETITPGTLRKARRVVAMGGAIDVQGFAPPWFRAEFNVFMDVPAAALLIREAPDLTLVSLDLTQKVIFGYEQMNRLRSGGRFARRLHRDIKLWFDLMKHFTTRGGGFNPHDPLAVAYLTHPEWYTTDSIPISIIEKPGFRYGEMIRDPRGTRVRVPFSINETAFLDYLVEKLVSE